ncbi:hypothetical protein P154DRAFT_566129 [Amniculicola lignicola CBS 123094]|uniref:Homeobox domain-containing protein n=1 Tax=Amniculicola lignicola CBS 123094 TaxID=1392246 RepID=A0A6A5W526_9PLEO|nr:hypothetical protein P154DRAFT_566129 [Amniculicola lignicola CBS 123094]
MVVLETKLMANVSQEMFGEGHAIAMGALEEGEEMPTTAVTPKPLVVSSSTTLYAALAPELSDKSGAFLVDAQVWSAPVKKHATDAENFDKLIWSGQKRAFFPSAANVATGVSVPVALGHGLKFGDLDLLWLRLANPWRLACKSIKCFCCGLMASSSWSDIINTHPIGSGLDAFRASAPPNLQQLQLDINSGELRDYVLDLILALQMLPASRQLPSSCDGKNLFGDLARLTQAINSGDFPVSLILPLLKAVLGNDDEEIIWAKAYELDQRSPTESSPHEQTHAVDHLSQLHHPITPRNDAEQTKLDVKRSRLPKASVKALKQWCDAHSQNPYPTDEEKMNLMSKTGLTGNQLSTWFINARRRGKINPRRASDTSVDGSHSSAISCPPAEVQGWQKMSPLDRWRHSPPEYEAASLRSISRAAAQSEPNSQGSSGSVEFLPSLSILSFGSSQSSSSASSAHSSKSNHSAASLERFSVIEPQRRRRRRKSGKVSLRPPKPQAEKRPYQCTFCTDTFKSKFDWTRHEETLHLSLESWTCTPRGGIDVDPANETATCAFCGIDDTSKSHLESHAYDECKGKHIAARTFYRKDHLRQHLRLVHGVDHFLPSTSKWKYEITQVRSRCGFCSERFIEWSQRNDHLASHFLAGVHMKEWKGCRGLDPGVALLVQNAMPPYLIGAETTAVVPFSATISSRPRANNDPRPTSFEFLTESLSQFVKFAREQGIAITDEHLQQEARFIVYEDNDPWNQTAADNPQWLSLFKQGHGLAESDNQIQGGLVNSVQEPMSTIPGLSMPWTTQDWMSPEVQNTMLTGIGNLAHFDATSMSPQLSRVMPYAWQSPECLAEFRERSLTGRTYDPLAICQPDCLVGTTSPLDVDNTGQTEASQCTLQGNRGAFDQTLNPNLLDTGHNLSTNNYIPVADDNLFQFGMSMGGNGDRMR